MKFLHKTKLPEIKKKKSHKLLYVKFIVSIFAILLVSLMGLIVKEYIDTHTFKAQSPVLFQSPMIIERVKLVSPVGSKSASLNVAYAEEIKNPYESNSPKGIAWIVNKEMFGIEHWGSLEELVRRESGWNPYSVNSSSGACGLSQSLPCSKMKCELWNYECQIKWMGNYIQNRYETPTEALNFHNLKNWY